MSNSKSNYFVGEPNKSLFCPICCNIYEDPVLTDCGHTFCRLCIQSKNDKCPIDNNICQLKLVNRIIIEQINDINVHCIFAFTENSNEEFVLDPNGCKEIIPYAKKIEHEAQCPFRIVNCPNNINCQPLRMKELEIHLNICKNLQCPNFKYKCNFCGTKEEVDEHVKNCRLDNMKEILSFYEEKMNNYEESIQELSMIISQKDDQINMLTNCISTLSHRMDNFEKKVEDKLNILDDNQQKLVIEMNKEYKRIGEEINYLKSRLMENRTRSIDSIRDTRDSQTTVKCLGTFVGHLSDITCLVCYGENLISGSMDNTIKIWDTTSKYTCIKTHEAHIGGIRRMFLKNNILYTSGDKDRKLMIWNLDSLEKIGEFDNAELIDSIGAIDDKVILGCNETIKIFDSTSFKLLKEVKEEKGTLVYTIVAQNRILYTGSYKSFKIWDTQTLNTFHKIPLPGRVVYGIAFYSKNVFVANDDIIYVLDSKTYQIQLTLTGHRAEIIDLVIAKSSLGDKLFSASKDKTIRVWNLDFLACSQILQRHEGNVTSLTAMNNRIFSGATDKCIKVWQISVANRPS